MGEYRNRAVIGNKLADKLKSLRAPAVPAL